ncbi:Amidase chyE [Colletotrichum shisoi]|uniref:Amidase chyE n=1 Tax=Colletotrichum shisoi TaxID=2078593 RepID=A0A5Q4BCX4_9PEZI|nr:Amidase chyE [Colletotrichum shisoi]
MCGISPFMSHGSSHRSPEETKQVADELESSLDIIYYRDLLSPEFHFVGTSDCEIVIALDKHYGLSFLEHLRGEFKFVLWDENKKRLIAGRDRYGIKGLY